MGPVYYGHLGTNGRYSGYQGDLIFQVGVYDKAEFGAITIIISVWIMQLSILKLTGYTTDILYSTLITYTNHIILHPYITYLIVMKSCFQAFQISVKLNAA